VSELELELKIKGVDLCKPVTPEEFRLFRDSVISESELGRTGQLLGRMFNYSDEIRTEILLTKTQSLLESGARGLNEGQARFEIVKSLYKLRQKWIDKIKGEITNV